MKSRISQSRNFPIFRSPSLLFMLLLYSDRLKSVHSRSQSCAFSAIPLHDVNTGIVVQFATGSTAGSRVTNTPETAGKGGMAELNQAYTIFDPK